MNGIEVNTENKMCGYVSPPQCRIESQFTENVAKLKCMSMTVTIQNCIN